MAAKRAKLDDDDTIEIQLLCTNDTHSKMEPVERDGKTMGGVLRRARAVSAMRAAVPAGCTLLLDAGDHFSGSEYFTFLQGEAEMVVLDALAYLSLIHI